MAIEVPDTIKEETHRCPHDFTRLATTPSGNQPKCKVNYSGGRNVLYLVASQGHLSCPYRIKFGNGIICACPVHYYLCNITATNELRSSAER
ncbi:MAG: hypothetical protein ABIJ52_03245 [Pseudomonadota bacterium]